MTLLVSLEVRSGGRGEDRAAYYLDGARYILALADGAGGVGGGASAAQTVLKAAEQLAHGVHSSPEQALAWADKQIELEGGLSTGVIVELTGEELKGASCGDSEAWLLDGARFVNLTAGQVRKPLLGEGAQLRAFGPMRFEGRLFIASDGITKYARAREIESCVLEGSPAEAAFRVAELVRLSSGSYQDDVSVIIAMQV